MVVRRAIKFSTIVAGRGAIEMELSRLIYKLDFNVNIQEQ
jgi:hypothetical protein